MAGSRRGIESEKALQINGAAGVYLEVGQLHPHQRRNGNVAHHHAGVRCCKEIFLGIGILVRAAELQRLVNADDEPAGDLLPPFIAALHTVVRARAPPPPAPYIPTPFPRPRTRPPPLHPPPPPTPPH